jgi:predicted nucleotidyltransferase
MPEKPYTITEIQNRIRPVAMRYGVERVSLFGSYARGEVKPSSDIDLCIDSL